MIRLFHTRFQYYKSLADKTFAQLTDEQLFWHPNAESNSLAVIVKHLSGNMISRWTNFLSEDGEKGWRNRDTEFVNDFKTRKDVLEYWEKGWRCFFNALEQVNDDNLHATIYIRGEAHTVLDAVLRQLAHYPYHIGQMVYIAKMLKDEQWQTLSVPRNQSAEYNAEIFSKFQQENPNASPVCYAKSDEVRDDYKTGM